MVNTSIICDLDGGDVAVNRNGIQSGDYLTTAVFARLFGGNREADTRSQYLRFEKNLSYWGNAFISPEKQFNSRTERAILENTLNDTGIENIKLAMLEDIHKLIPEHVQEVVEIQVFPSATNPQRIEFSIYLLVTGAYRTIKGVA